MAKDRGAYPKNSEGGKDSQNRTVSVSFGIHADVTFGYTKLFETDTAEASVAE